MDSPSTTTRTAQMKPTRSERGEDRGKAHSTHRSTRYKEKYQVMRERFERVNAAKEAYQRDLQLATEKIRKIQEENDLLLDAMLGSSPPSSNSNPKHYQTSHPPQPMVPSQGYAQAQYPSAPVPLPPPGAYPPRPEHSDHPPHNYNYSHSHPSRLYPYPSYGEGRETAAEAGHHYSGSIASSRSRGLPPDVGYRS